MNLYCLSKEVENLYEALVNAVDEETGEVNIDVSKALEVKEEEFNQKAIAVATVERRFEVLVKDIEAEINRLTLMKKRYENAGNRLKNSLTEACQRLGKNKVEGIGASISFRTSERTVVDETILPEEFFNVTMVKKPDLKRIKAALEYGETIEGAKLEVVRHIQIK